MWINALSVFRVENADTTEWVKAFSSFPLVDPVGGERKTYGFTPLGEEELFVDQMHDYYAFVGSLAERMLPSEAVDREVIKFKNANPEMAAAGGDADKLWCEIEQRMLPHAAIRETRTPAVFCAKTSLLYVFGQTKLGMEALLTSVRNALGSFVCIPMSPSIEVAGTLTEWISKEAPDGIALGEDVVFEVSDGSRTTIIGQDLKGDVVRKHLDAGERVKRLSLVWRDELVFEISEKGEIRKIGPPGCKMKPRTAVLHWPEIMEKLPAFVRELGGHLGYELDALDPGGEDLESPSEEEGIGAVETEAEPLDSPSAAAPGFVPLVVPSFEAPADVVHAMLDRLASRHPPDGIVILKRPADSYRAVYSWAADNGIQVELAEWGEELAWPCAATALVCTASDEQVIQDMRALAIDRGCKVMVARE